MFDLSLDFDNITMSSILKSDISDIQEWINGQQSRDYDNSTLRGIKDFYNRFLEYYISENEFFLKIKYNNHLIGIIKGRFEFKSINESWITCFLIDETYRSLGIGTKIINQFKEHLSNRYGINVLYAMVVAENKLIEKFWNKNNFAFQRMVKDYYDLDGFKANMLIYKYQ
jgi:ribosomal protein S18 acetylase RimI-like enzyme